MNFMPFIALGLKIEIEPPTLDFDITSVIQFLIFIVVALFLNKYVLRPCLKAYDQREALTSGANSEASALKQKADAANNEYVSKRQAVFAEIEDERKSKLRAARDEQNARLESKRQSVQKDIAVRQAAFDKSMADARTASQSTIDELSAEIARKLLA